MLTVEYLRQRLGYDPRGYLFFKKSPRLSKVGKRLGSGRCDTKGYVHVRFEQKTYREHRLIYFYHFGVFLKTLDHINGIRHDNRIENLRQATARENALNRNSHTKSQSQYKCVYKTKYNTWKGEVKIRLGRGDIIITSLSSSSEKKAALYVDRIMLEWFGPEYFKPNLKVSLDIY